MANEKITYVNAFNFVLDNCELPTEVREKIESAIARESKRNSKSGVSAKTQAERNELDNEVLSALAEIGKGTVTQILKAMHNDILTNQKVTSCLTRLKSDNKVTVAKEGKSTIYSIAE